MKNYVFFLAATLLFMSACNNNKKDPVTVKSEDGTASVTIDPASETMSPEKIEAKVKHLQSLQPYTTEQMRAMFPEELAGAKGENFNSRNAMGASYAEADYILNDSTKFKLGIFDCAGQAGAGIYNMQYIMVMNTQLETDDEYTRSISIKSGKAIEHGDKRNNEHSILWLAGDRLLVNIESKVASVDLLKQAANELKLK